MAELTGRHGPLEIARVLASRRMLVAFLMGFSSGLPLLLTLTLLQAWLTLHGVSIAVIGLFALVGLPYIFEFVWSPLFDRYRMPFLGRRRGWLFVIQIILAAAIVGLGRGRIGDAQTPATSTYGCTVNFAACPTIPLTGTETTPMMPDMPIVSTQLQIWANPPCSPVDPAAQGATRLFHPHQSR